MREQPIAVARVVAILLTVLGHTAKWEKPTSFLNNVVTIETK